MNSHPATRRVGVISKGMLVVSTCWLSATLLGSPLATQAPSGCHFSLTDVVEPARLVGASAVVARAHVASHPGAPVSILTVDLTGAEALSSGSTLGSYGVEIRNVSDQIVSRIGVVLYAGAGNNWGGIGGGSDMPLAPGKAVWIRGNGAVRLVPKESEQPKFLAVVESVHLGACIYRPAQVIPLEWWSVSFPPRVMPGPPGK